MESLMWIGLIVLALTAIEVDEMGRRKGSKNKIVPELTPVELSELEPVYSYVSYKSTYICAFCGAILPMERQHWVDQMDNHLCLNHAREAVSAARDR